MLTKAYLLCLGFLFYFAAIAAVPAQTTDEAAPEPIASQPIAAPAMTTFNALLATFISSQQNLAQQMEALITQGATSEQMQTWQQQNASTIQARQQLAINLAAATPPQPLAYITTVQIPEEATQELGDFLTTQADLFNQYAYLHNQALQTGATDTQVATLFQQQNTPDIQDQQQRAQVLSAQSNQQPLPVPPPLVIPAGSTPQMTAFLTLRDQLVRAQIVLHNQNVNSTTAQRDAALQQWQQQNASSLQQLQQLAQNLTTVSSN